MRRQCIRDGEGAAQEPARAPVRGARSSGWRARRPRGLAGPRAGRSGAAPRRQRIAPRHPLLPRLSPRARHRERRLRGYGGRAAPGRDPIRTRPGAGSTQAPAALRHRGKEPRGRGAPGRALRSAREGTLLQAREAGVLDPRDRRPGALGAGIARPRRARKGHAGGGSAGGAFARAHAPVRGPSAGALSLVSAALGRRIRPTRRVGSDARRRKVMKKMAQEKKANLKAADKAADKEAKAKDAALQAAVTQIERQFGQGSLMRLGDENAIQVETIPTGALSLDLALGVG